MSEERPASPRARKAGSSPGAPDGPSGSGATAVRSGLAKRRSPVLARIRDWLSSLRRIVMRDPLSLFLLVASIGLVLAFALLLGSIEPSSRGRQVPLSTVQTLAKQQRIAAVLLLDHDDRVELTTRASTPLLLANGTLPDEPVPVRPAHRTGRHAVKAKAPPVLPTGAQPLWASYPASGAQTQQLVDELTASGAVVAVDQQAWKST